MASLVYVRNHSVAWVGELGGGGVGASRTMVARRLAYRVRQDQVWRARWIVWTWPVKRVWRWVRQRMPSG